MNLVRQEELARLVRDYPGVEEIRKAFLVDFLIEATPESVAAVLQSSPPNEAEFIRACVHTPSLAA